MGQFKTKVEQWNDRNMSWPKVRCEECPNLLTKKQEKYSRTVLKRYLCYFCQLKNGFLRIKKY